MVQRPQTQTLAALVAGNVRQIYVHPGQHVAAGQLLATISNPQLVDAEATAHDAYLSAQGRARTTASTNATLPAQNRSAIVQAQANLQTARFNLNQAIQDERAGAQSGLGYGGTSAAQQRAAADANVAQRATDLREAKRIADADRDLYAQKAIAKNTRRRGRRQAAAGAGRLRPGQARPRRDLRADRASDAGALRTACARTVTPSTQAEAALAAARRQRGKTRAATSKPRKPTRRRRYEDWRYAADQVARLRDHRTVRRRRADDRDARPATRCASCSRATRSPPDRRSSRCRPTPASSCAPKSTSRTSRTCASASARSSRARTWATRRCRGHVAHDRRGRAEERRPVEHRAAGPHHDRAGRTVPYLRDGMTVDVDIITQDRPHVLAIPADAIRRDDDGSAYVLAVVNGPHGEAHRAPRHDQRHAGDRRVGRQAGRRRSSPSATSASSRTCAVTPTAMPTSSPSPHDRDAAARVRRRSVLRRSGAIARARSSRCSA